jgi:predicted membrane chloride channel (bestrophin family)
VEPKKKKRKRDKRSIRWITKLDKQFIDAMLYQIPKFVKSKENDNLNIFNMLAEEMNQNLYIDDSNCEKFFSTTQMKNKLEKVLGEFDAIPKLDSSLPLEYRIHLKKLVSISNYLSGTNRERFFAQPFIQPDENLVASSPRPVENTISTVSSQISGESDMEQTEKKKKKRSRLTATRERKSVRWTVKLDKQYIDAMVNQIPKYFNIQQEKEKPNILIMLAEEMNQNLYNDDQNCEKWFSMTQMKNKLEKVLGEHDRLSNLPSSLSLEYRLYAQKLGSISKYLTGKNRTKLLADPVLDIQVTLIDKEDIAMDDTAEEIVEKVAQSPNERIVEKAVPISNIVEKFIQTQIETSSQLDFQNQNVETTRSNKKSYRWNPKLSEWLLDIAIEVCDFLRNQKSNLIIDFDSKVAELFNEKVKKIGLNESKQISYKQVQAKIPRLIQEYQ